MIVFTMAVAAKSKKSENPVIKNTRSLKKPRKQLKRIDPKRLTELLNKGLSDTRIAELIDSTQSSVWKAKQRLFKELSHIQHYRNHRTEYLIQQGFEERLIQSKLRQHLLEDDVISKLSEEQKKRWYDTFNLSAGTIQDKEINIINNFGTQNIQINKVDERRAEIKARLKELGIDPLTVNKLDNNTIECKAESDK